MSDEIAIIENVNNEEDINFGIIRPISPTDGYPASHWEEVHSIVDDVLARFNFKSRLVSESDEPGIIHRNIVQNLYYRTIVICDVSAHNPNVMFELGLRLAFDKPTIIIKDDHTKFAFDTSVIEHLEYPKDLRITTIEKFKNKLSGKIVGLIQSIKNGESPSFLQNYGKFTTSQLQESTISGEQYIINTLEKLQTDFSLIHQKLNLQQNREIIWRYSSVLFNDIDDVINKTIDDFANYHGKAVFEVLSDQKLKQQFIDFLSRVPFVIKSGIKLQQIIKAVEETLPF